eukprot:12361445-Ditylum_brightwellii.AAC.1
MLVAVAVVVVAAAARVGFTAAAARGVTMFCRWASSFSWQRAQKELRACWSTSELVGGKLAGRWVDLYCS